MISDHSVKFIYIIIVPSQVVYNSWLQDPEFLDLSRKVINKTVTGTGLFKPQKKLKGVKTLSKEWAARKD